MDTSAMTDDIRNRLAEVLREQLPGFVENAYWFGVDAILEAFDVSEKGAALSQPEQAEEWEYRSVADYGRTWAQGTREEVEASLKEFPTDRVYRRRKAGPWMPVEEGESDE